MIKVEHRIASFSIGLRGLRTVFAGPWRIRRAWRQPVRGL